MILLIFENLLLIPRKDTNSLQEVIYFKRTGAIYMVSLLQSRRQMNWYKRESFVFVRKSSAHTSEPGISQYGEQAVIILVYASITILSERASVLTSETRIAG